MSSDMIVKLTKGVRTLNINDGTNYRVARGFVPPAVQFSPILSVGGSLNAFGGAELIDNPATVRPFNFGVHILGDSEGEVTRNYNVLSFMLGLAGDPDEPLYLEHRPSSPIAAESLWGQAGTNRRYQITHAQGLTGGDFTGPADLRAKAMRNCVVNTTMGPMALGKDQLVASASGGIIEYKAGAADGLSKGLIAPEGTTNVFDNPVFGHATYTTGWTIGTSLVTARNTVKAYLYPGALASMKVISRSTTNNILSQTITLSATSWCITFWVKLADSSAVSSSTFLIHYNGSDRVSTYEHLGDGLYRVWATFTGSGGAAVVGCTIMTKKSIYITGGQVENKAYPTPLAWGDLLGCAWSGTAHAASSTSTRTVGIVKLPVSETLTAPLTNGTISMIWIPHVPNTHPNVQNLWQFSSNLAAYFNSTGDTINFTDGTNTATTAAQVFSAFAIYVLHFVWDASGLVIYVNGASAATATHTVPSTLGAYLFLGWDGTTSVQNLLGTITDFRTYDRALTAAEILADYNNVYPIAAAGQRVGYIPWFWTQDTDYVVDNYNDATHDHFAVAGGIPGSVKAMFRFQVAATAPYLYLSNLITDAFPNPSDLFYDQSGTGTAATDVGSAVLTTSVNTGATAVATVTKTIKQLSALLGKEFHMACRYEDAGADLVMYQQIVSPTTIAGDVQPQGSSGGSRILAVLPPIVMYERAVYDKLDDPTLTDVIFQIVAYRTVAGAANVLFDAFFVLPRPLVLLSLSSQGAVYDSRLPTTVALGSGALLAVYPVDGDVIELEPEMFNTLLMVTGSNVLYTISKTITFSNVSITPRYSLV